jgi:hypothetical protein
MGRLGFCYKKPKALPMGADEAAQIAHIEAYEALLNGLEYTPLTQLPGIFSER